MSTPPITTPTPLVVDLVSHGSSWTDWLRDLLPSLFIALGVVYVGYRFTMKQAGKAWSETLSLEQGKWQAEQRLKVYSEHLVLLRQRTEQITEVLERAPDVPLPRETVEAALAGLVAEVDMRYRTTLVCSDEYGMALDLLHASSDVFLNEWVEKGNPPGAADDFAALMRSHIDILLKIARSEVQSLSAVAVA